MADDMHVANSLMNVAWSRVDNKAMCHRIPQLSTQWAQLALPIACSVSPVLDDRRQVDRMNRMHRKGHHGP